MLIYNVFILSSGEWIFLRTITEAEYRFHKAAYDARDDILLEAEVISVRA